MRAATFLAISAVVAAPVGCQENSTSKPLTPDEFEYELARFWLVEGENKFAAAVVGSIVAGSAPPGGPPPLGTLMTDAGWRLMLVTASPEIGRLPWVPSPLDAPDPELRVKVTSRATSS